MKHKKHKILFFIESLSGGGAEKVLVTLLKHLDYEKYEVTLLLVNEVGVHFDEINKLNSIRNVSLIVKSLCDNGDQIYQRIKYKFIYRILPAWLVCWLFIPKGYNTYVAFVEGFCTKIISYARGKKVAWVHIDLKNYPWTISNRIYTTKEKEQKAYCRYDKVVCVSKSVEHIMKDYYGLCNTMTIYNPVDARNISFLSSKTPDYIVDTAYFNIISIGRLVPQKGYDLLIPIVKKLVDVDKINVKLWIIGDGGERQNLERQARNLNLDGDIIFTGFLKNPYALLRQMNLFVCSSRAEGYSLVIAESLILGIPVVSTCCSGPNELLAEGKYGKLCDGYDELYETIKKAVIDTNYYNSEKQKAISGNYRFNVENTVTRIESIL